MKKFISLVILALALVSAVVHANGNGGMLQPSVPSHSYQPYQPSSDFNMSGNVSGSTNGYANANGTPGGRYETYSTGEADSFLDMKSTQTEFGSGTNCGTNCADNFAQIKSSFHGKHESGAFASDSGGDGSSSIAHTVSGVGFDGHTAIETNGFGHHNGDWNHGHYDNTHHH